MAKLAELQQQVRELSVLVAELREENGRLRAENAELKRRLEAQERASKRQAAPFSKGAKKTDPKRPGRKPGQGRFSRRALPREEEITHRVEVPLPAEGCPFCGGSQLVDKRVEMAYCTDLPEPPKPQVTAYRIEVCTCGDCGRSVRAPHPEVAPSQRGATAHRLGAGVFARAHALHYGFGVPMRKVPAILKELCGISITQSAIQQDALRRRRAEVGAAYKQLRESVKHAARVFTDDTGWRINGESAYLMGFDTDAAAVYQIRRRHRNEEVRELIPSDYPGIMHTDRAPTYDAAPLELVAQQKCGYHILRSIDQVLADKTGPARAFGEHLKGLLQEAIALWHAYHEGCATNFAAEAQRIQQAVTEHLKPRALSDPDNQRLLEQLSWHHAGGNLLRFLDQPDVAEPTNNRAERRLRPAVIARKVSHCSQNDAGADTYAAFKSVLETAHKSAQSLVAALTALFRSTDKPPDWLVSACASS